jgi:hypothetical protein
MSDDNNSLASSSRFAAFSVVFGIAVSILYVVSDMAKLPLFTYHPGTDSFDWGWAPARKDEGPAMYWYGWLATSAIGATLLGLVAALLPVRLAQRIPFALTWLVPLLLTPVLIYSLKYYWRW